MSRNNENAGMARPLGPLRPNLAGCSRYNIIEDVSREKYRRAIRAEISSNSGDDYF